MTLNNACLLKSLRSRVVLLYMLVIAFRSNALLSSSCSVAAWPHRRAAFFNLLHMRRIWAISVVGYAKLLCILV